MFMAYVVTSNGLVNITTGQPAPKASPGMESQRAVIIKRPTEEYYLLAERKAKSFEQRFGEETANREFALKKNLASREKVFYGKEKFKRGLEGENVLVPKIQKLREKKFVAEQEVLVQGFNTETVALFEEGKAKTLKEIAYERSQRDDLYEPVVIGYNVEAGAREKYLGNLAEKEYLAQVEKERKEFEAKWVNEGGSFITPSGGLISSSKNSFELNKGINAVESKVDYFASVRTKTGLEEAITKDKPFVGNFVKVASSSELDYGSVVGVANPIIGEAKKEYTRNYFQAVSDWEKENGLLFDNPESDFVRASKEVGQKAVKGDYFGIGTAFSYALLSGFKESGEIITQTSKKLSKYVEYEKKDVFSINPLDRAKVVANIGLGFFGGGFGGVVSTSSMLIRDSPILIPAAIGFGSKSFSMALKNPVEFGGKATSKINSSVGGFVNSQLLDYDENPAYYTGELIGSFYYGGKVVSGAGNLTKDAFVRTQAFISRAKYYPQADLVSPELVSMGGSKLFPEVTRRGAGKQVLDYFYNKPYSSVLGQKAVYSATDYPFTPFIGRNLSITSGRGLAKTVDVPGLYTSTKGVSTYFLRLNQGVGYSVSLLPRNPFTSPKILAVYSTAERIPSAFRTSVEKAQSFFGKYGQTFTSPKGTPGIPYVSPAVEFGAKLESEAVIQVGSNLTRVGYGNTLQRLVGFSKFTKINGRIIPIYEYLPTTGVSKTVAGAIKSATSYGGESSLGVKEYALLSYSNIGSAILLAYSQKSIPSSKTVSNNKIQSNYSFALEYSTPKISYKISSGKPSSSTYYGAINGESLILSKTDYSPSYSGYSVSYKPSEIISFSSVKSTKYNYKPPTYPFRVSKPVKSKRQDEQKMKLPKISVSFKRVGVGKLFTPGDVSNVVLPIRTDWLKALKFYSKKPKVKSIKLLPNVVKGNKDIVKLLGVKI